MGKLADDLEEIENMELKPMKKSPMLKDGLSVEEVTLLDGLAREQLENARKLNLLYNGGMKDLEQLCMARVNLLMNIIEANR